MKRNILRELLNEGKPTLGTHVIIPWPGVVEVIGYSDAFDYIEYVGEYSPFSLEQLDNWGRAIELFPNLSSMMKVDEQTRGFIAQRALDAGIQNVLFSDCRTADEVRECIRFVRSETPEAGGIHGYGLRRYERQYIGYTLDKSAEAWTKAMDNAVIAIMIEKKGAVENLEEILSVKGVDMVQFGPADYSISIGKPGQKQDPEVQKAEQYTIETALKMGVSPRVEIAGFEQAKPYVEMGVRHFCIGWDIRIINNWCKEQAVGMRKLLNP
jgi:2-keto-3-deoxy-L-rhamnonate aldolase RhmA